MDALKISHTEDTPQVNFDPANTVYEITGKALPEDAVEFFGPIHEWIESFLETKPGDFHLTINLTYLNSSATRYIFNMLCLLEDAYEEGEKTSLTWKYEKDDEVMEMKGEDLEEMLDFPIKLVTY
ncbi:MAG: hypothetical protein ACI85F_002201 [Bacteroidia bacterium]|jgi:hypothetical protein